MEITPSPKVIRGEAPDPQFFRSGSGYGSGYGSGSGSGSGSGYGDGYGDCEDVVA